MTLFGWLRNLGSDRREAALTRWIGKVIREPGTGRVSFCVASGLRMDTWWRRWVWPEAVLLLSADAALVRRFRCGCMSCFLSRPFVTVMGLEAGSVRAVPVPECAVAPATEAVAFLAAINESEEA